MKTKFKHKQILTTFNTLKIMSEVAHDNWKRLKLYEDAGMIDWLYFYIIFISKWISFSSLCKIVRSSVILLLPEYVLNICHRNDKLPNINQPINQYWISLIIITNFLIHFNVTKCSENRGGCGDKQLVSYLQ